MPMKFVLKQVWLKVSASKDLFQQQIPDDRSDSNLMSQLNAVQAVKILFIISDLLEDTSYDETSCSATRLLVEEYLGNCRWWNIFGS